VGCRARDARQVKDVFVQLVGALNFDYEEADTRLFAVYEDCIRCVRTRKFEEPLRGSVCSRENGCARCSHP
jgi:hypothetical protein